MIYRTWSTQVDIRTSGSSAGLLGKLAEARCLPSLPESQFKFRGLVFGLEAVLSTRE